MLSDKILHRFIRQMDEKYYATKAGRKRSQWEACLNLATLLKNLRVI